MPKVAMDFSKTVIYHFFCKDADIKCEYVGSTTNFNQRKGTHKHSCVDETSKGHHYKVYQTIREHGGWTNWDMKPLEEFPCENKTQQVIREQYWIERLKPELNCYKAHREGETQNEKNKAYNEANKESLIEYKKAYYEANKEELSEKHKAYNEANKEVLSEKKKKYQQANKEAIAERTKVWREANKKVISKKKKAYYEANNQVITEYKKAYYEANKELLTEKQNVKYTCVCGSVCRIGEKAPHERSMKHQAFIAPMPSVVE